MILSKTIDVTVFPNQAKRLRALTRLTYVTGIIVLLSVGIFFWLSTTPAMKVVVQAIFVHLPLSDTAEDRLFQRVALSLIAVGVPTQLLLKEVRLKKTRSLRSSRQKSAILS